MTTRCVAEITRIWQAFPSCRQSKTEQRRRPEAFGEDKEQFDFR